MTTASNLLRWYVRTSMSIHETLVYDAQIVFKRIAAGEGDKRYYAVSLPVGRDQITCIFVLTTVLWVAIRAALRREDVQRRLREEARDEDQRADAQSVPHAPQ